MTGRIRLLEELSLNAWPAAQTLLLDGWVLRFAGGYTRRANSILPLYDCQMSLAHKIDACEAIYTEKGLPPIFKMTAASLPVDLDEQLVQRGYLRDADTSVQTCGLDSGFEEVSRDVELMEHETEEWQAAFCEMNQLKNSRQAFHCQIIQSIVPQKCFAALRAGERMVACGLGVLQDGHIGLFDIVTHPEYRQRGYGEQLVRALLGWGCQQGAHTGYLQVMLNNTNALRLYEKIGFCQVYSYWYRVRP